MAWEPSEAITVVDQIDEFVHGAGGVPFTDQVRLDAAKLDPLLERLRTAVRGGPLELTSLVDELNALIHGAKPLPLTSEIRIEREAIYDRIDRMRAAFAKPSREHLPPPLAAALGEFDDFLGSAKLVPLTTQVRLDRRRAQELLDRLRAVAPGGVDQLDALFRNAKSIPFTNEIRVSIVEVSEALDRVEAG